MWPNWFPDQAKGPKLAGMGAAKATLVPVWVQWETLSSFLVAVMIHVCSLGEESCVFQNSGFTPFLAGLRKKESVFVVG